MARSTVIDSLLVVLGLDPAPYKKGEKEAEKSQKQLRDNVKKTNDEMSAAIKGTARQIGLLVLGFESIRGAVGFLGDISNSDAAMGRLAKNTGVSVHELNTWGLAVKQLGGNASEVQGDISNLAQSFVALNTQGTTSPLLQLLRMASVQTEDASGKTRNLFDIYQDLGGYLRGFDRDQAYQYARQAGISDGLLNVLLEQDDARRKILSDAEKQNNLDDAAAKRAQQIQTAWAGIRQEAENFGREILTALTPAILAFVEALKPIEPIILRIVEKLKEFKLPEKFASGLMTAAHALERVLDRLDAASKKNDDFEAADKRAAAGDPNSQRITLWEGIRSFWDLDLRHREGESESDYRARLAEMRRGASGQKAMAAASADMRAAESDSYGGVPTSVQIDNITVNTAATDADGIARDLNGALNRKLVVQANTGQN